MLNQDYTAKLLDLEDVNITKVENRRTGRSDEFSEIQWAVVGIRIL